MPGREGGGTEGGVDRMSDWITIAGRRYYEESYLLLANENAKRAQARITELETLTTGDQITIRRYKQERDNALAEVEPLRNAIKQVFGPGGCGCVKDLPGDNSTCGAHQTLFDVAREPKS
jgi:hypothetical protein